MVLTTNIFINLYNKPRHSYIYVYVLYSRPNGWTEWAEILCGHSWVAGAKKIRNDKFFFKFIIFFLRVTPGPSAEEQILFFFNEIKFLFNV